MRTLGNILWFLLAGLWLAIGYATAGFLNFITIIGIPFGIQAFKLAGYALWPFGRAVVRRPDADVAISTLGNVLWFFLGGWFLVLMHLATGLLLLVTIVGIPLGIANIKMAGLALAPFGRQIVELSSLQSGQVGGSVVSTVPMLDDRTSGQLGTGDGTSPRLDAPKD
jgi:uncharacterized membrane protein YccF (DUF307 family)